MVYRPSFAERFIRLNIIKRFWRGTDVLAGLASSFIILTALSVHEFGLYQLVLAAVALTDAFSVNFFDDVVSNDISRAIGDDKRAFAKRLFCELAFLKIGLGVLTSGALFLGADLVAGIYHGDIGSYIKTASFLIGIGAVRSAAEILLRSVVSMKAAGASTVEDIVKLGIVSWFFFLGELSIGRTLSATLIGALVALIYVGVGFCREYKVFFHGVGGVKKVLFVEVVKTYGKWVLLRAFIKRTAKPVRPWLIVTLLNAEAVALYTLASNLVTMLKDFFPTAGSSLIALHLNNQTRLKSIFSRGIKYSFFYGLVFSVLILLFVPPFVGIFLPKYLPALPLFFIFLIAVPLHGVQTLEMEILTAFREQKILSARIFAEVLMGSGLIIVFVPILGVLATGVGPTFAIIWRTWFLYRQIVKKYPWLRLDLGMLFRFDAEDKLIIKRAVAEAKFFLRATRS